MSHLCSKCSVKASVPFLNMVRFLNARYSLYSNCGLGCLYREGNVETSHICPLSGRRLLATGRQGGLVRESGNTLCNLCAHPDTITIQSLFMHLGACHIYLYARWMCARCHLRVTVTELCAWRCHSGATYTTHAIAWLVAQISSHSMQP